MRFLLGISIYLLSGIAGYADENDQWSIQVGVYRLPSSLPDINALNSVGEVRRHQNKSGLHVVSIGPFTDQAQAESALQRTKKLVPDAFLVSGQRGHLENVTSEQTHVDRLLALLPSSEQGNIVYLDGRLHIKQGREFMPAEEYLKVHAR